MRYKPLLYWLAVIWVAGQMFGTAGMLVSLVPYFAWVGVVYVAPAYRLENGSFK